MRDAGTTLARDGRIWITIVATHQRAQDAAHVYAVVLKERTIFGDRNGLDQMGRKVVEADHLALRSLASSHRSDEFRFKIRPVEMPVAFEFR